MTEIHHLAPPAAWPVISSAMARAIAPRRVLTVSEWADANRRLSSKGSAEAGAWRTLRNPPLREPMDALSKHSIARVIALMFPIQFGKTEVALNFVGYTMDHNPGPIMVCLPGEVSMTKWGVQKLQPMIDESAAVRSTLTSVATRESSNTRTFKDFSGGQLYLEHAGSPSRLKSTSARDLVVDELDEFVASLQSGDDPLEMLDGRTSAFPYDSKRLYISSPQIRATSRIHWLWERSDQRKYHVPCPECGELQPLLWSGLHWSTHRSPSGRRAAWYVCAHCASVIQEHRKVDMIHAGGWVAARPEVLDVRAYNINCLYYQPGLGPSWSDMAEKWLEAQGDPAKLKTFVNDRLAEPWEDASTRNVRANIVAERAEPYRLRTAPEGVLMITAGVDTQDDRLEAHIVGWGRGGRFWTLDYAVLAGDPVLDEVWAALTDLLNRPIEHVDGARLAVEACSVDMFGHRTEDVKAWVRARRVRRPMASFGATSNTAPLLGRARLQDVTWRGQTDKRGVHTYPIGTVSAKHVLFARLAADADAFEKWERLPSGDDKPATAERLCHFSDELDVRFFDGLISEIYNPAKNRFEKRRGAVRNEPLDTWVHAFAAAHHPELRIHRMTETDWARREASIRAASRQPAATEPAPAPVEPAAAAPSPSAAAAPPKSRIVGPSRGWGRWR